MYSKTEAEKKIVKLAEVKLTIIENLQTLIMLDNYAKPEQKGKRSEFAASIIIELRDLAPTLPDSELKRRINHLLFS